MKKATTYILKALFLICLNPLYILAEEVEIDGIKYNLIKKTNEATVISKEMQYTGDIIIPSSIIFEEIEYDVTGIEHSAFNNCYGLTSVSIPNSVTSIGESAFSNCYRLNCVNIPNTLTSIEQQVFHGCSGLTTITIPNSVTSIGIYAFYGCTGLTSVTIPSSVTFIGKNAFHNCSRLTSITIPNVTTIEEYSFCGCSGLTSITIPNSVTSIGIYAFDGCTGLGSVSFPNGVTSIGNGAFNGCSGLNSIDIPNSVTTIKGLAFYGCSGLRTIKIGSGTKEIGGKAFANCCDLEEVTCKATITPSTQTNTFENSLIEHAKLIVPDESLDSYKTTPPWSGFGTFEGLSGTISEKEKCATPSINYNNGKITFKCETEGVTYWSTITNPDITSYTGNEINLGGTYYIKVYATKPGYSDSDEATAEINLLDNSGSHIKGDVNGDDLVNMSDVTQIINIILGKE